MSALSMSCVVPFPLEGIKCPLCDKPQRKTAAWKEHCRKVHKVDCVETPTTCLACQRVFTSFRKASTHYTRCKSTSQNPSRPVASTSIPVITLPNLSGTTDVPPSNPPSPDSSQFSGPLLSQPSPQMLSPRSSPISTFAESTSNSPTYQDLSPRLSGAAPSPTRRRPASTTLSPASTANNLISEIRANLTPLLTDNTSPPVSPARSPPPVNEPVTPPHSAVDPAPPASPAPAPDLASFREKWLAIFTEDLSWEDFSAQIDSFSVEGRALAQDLISQPTRRPVARDATRPAPRRPAHSTIPRRFDASEAQKIQRLYKHSKKRAIRKILREDTPSYTGTPQVLHEFFTETFGPRESNTTLLQEHLNAHVPQAPADESLFSPISAEEIQLRLRSASNTSPGPDRLEYRHLKKLDPRGTLLSLIFNKCQTQQDVPPSWKSASTILIHKKGPTDDPSNFRPIALMSCLYKLLMGCLSKRLTKWSIDNDILSPEQKSARPTEGCYEHTFLLQSLIGDARRNQKNIFLSWLDLRNAFGSLPHSSLQTTLLHIGVPPSMVSFIMNAYRNSSTSIRAGANETLPIPISAGVKQGCPMSPILFNLCIELLIRSVKLVRNTRRNGGCLHHDQPLSILAYADDLVLIARGQDHLQLLLHAVSSAADVVGLTFRPDKCASLSFTNSKRSPNRIEPFSYSVQTSQIAVLSEEETYRYLGVPIGLIQNTDNIESLVTSLSADLTKINSSLLAPWQKLDAIRTFVQPCLTFALRAGNPSREHLATFRSTLCRVVKDICNLPTRATTTYLFAAKRCGGLGLQDPLMEHDVQTIIHSLKLLSSSDNTVSTIARQELFQTVLHFSRHSPTPALVSNFLSHQDDERLENPRYRASSIWTQCRKSTKRLKITFTFTESSPPTISTEESHPILSQDASRFLHTVVQEDYATKLQEFPDQGKVARSLAIDKYANGSTWQYTGLNLRFKDWRFIHRARLNVLPVNAVKARWSSASSPTCRNCATPETLPHVLCHCLPNMSAILHRHNKIVNRLVSATRSGTITTDSTVPNSGCNLRPDIIIEDDTTVLIIDVCCPFDNGSEALTDAANIKLTKYAPLQEYFETTGKRCTILPFVIGSLGTWFPSNESTLSHLGMSRSYKSLFRKLTCTDVIQSSTDIYRHHLKIDRDLPSYNAVPSEDPPMLDTQL